MRSHHLLLAAALAGCASSGSSSSPTNQPDRTILTTDRLVRTTVAPSARVPIDAPAAQVYSALAEAYLELGVDTKLIDTGARRIGNIDFFMSRRMGGRPISEYLSCGDTPHGGAIADQYRVFMSLVSTVHEAGQKGAELETAFSAYARDQRGVSSDRIACGTTGRLEERIRKTVALKLGVPAK